MKRLKKVQESLNEFNKAFSGFLYGIRTNAHCVEFSRVCHKYFKDENLLMKVDNEFMKKNFFFSF